MEAGGRFGGRKCLKKKVASYMSLISKVFWSERSLALTPYLWILRVRDLGGQ
jgi:hypothetical protein